MPQLLRSAAKVAGKVDDSKHETDNNISISVPDHAVGDVEILNDILNAIECWIIPIVEIIFLYFKQFFNQTSVIFSSRVCYRP